MAHSLMPFGASGHCASTRWPGRWYTAGWLFLAAALAAGCHSEGAVPKSAHVEFARSIWEITAPDGATDSAIRGVVSRLDPALRACFGGSGLRGTVVATIDVRSDGEGARARRVRFIPARAPAAEPVRQCVVRQLLEAPYPKFRGRDAVVVVSVTGMDRDAAAKWPAEIDVLIEQKDYDAARNLAVRLKQLLPRSDTPWFALGRIACLTSDRKLLDDALASLPGEAWPALRDHCGAAWDTLIGAEGGRE